MKLSQRLILATLGHIVGLQVHENHFEHLVVVVIETTGTLIAIGIQWLERTSSWT